MITFEESILMTVILENIEQELSVEQTSPQPRRSPSPLLTVYSIVMGRFWKVSCEQCALSRIREVNMLSFIEITSYLYDHLWGKYPDDSYFGKYYARLESRTNITTTSKESFHIANGLLYRNGKVLESIQITIILENTRQELSLEQTSPQPRRNPSTLLMVYSIVMGS